ncbi:MAG TPA: cupin domain-containing protein [Blastocatellia bacterium]
MNKHIRWIFIVTVASLLIAFFARGRFQSGSSAAQDKAALAFTDVIKQSLSDPELKDYEVVSRLMTVPQGFADTVPHRHDAELFGYVIEGEVEIQLAGRPQATYRQGQMFYEPRNIVHSMLRNQSREQAAKVLLLFITRKGRSLYTPEKQ